MMRWAPSFASMRKIVLPINGKALYQANISVREVIEIYSSTHLVVQ